ncbi:LETM1-like protein-domain-containing protein [Boletus edulis BED1]|uniref:LETM1-like protein-domain-containing protein n=1 Tax=Boletus edulis BED1 TaxID=1328754 RepID=A0AAD4G5A4_BOLED|nr:LETM1-like protein-domain-containing protein [Boletus edulis BED1]
MSFLALPPLLPLDSSVSPALHSSPLHSQKARRRTPNPSPPRQRDGAPLLSCAWKKVKHEAQHYWHGSKLLVSEVRISARLQWKILHGESLTRRERRQLRRTTQDLLKLIPFSAFVIIPFMELLLPVTVKEEKQRKLLRETLRESGLRANAHTVGQMPLKSFFRKARSTGKSPSVADIINVAKLFDDDLTLDNLSRPQLGLHVPIHGGAIRSWLMNLRRDDQAIYAEGVDELSTSELQAACQSRGIRTTGVSPGRLRDELSTWIQLHLHNRVSGVLLILGRAFHFDKKQGDDEDGKTAVIQSLESVMCGLPDNLGYDIIAELEIDSDNASYKQKLEVLQQQEELIEDEQEQEEKEEVARRAKREADELEARLARSLLPDSELHPVPEEESARMTTEQLKELVEALSIMSAKWRTFKPKRTQVSFWRIDQAHPDNAYQGRQPALAIRLTRRQLPPDDLCGCPGLTTKLDVDKDGFVEIEHVLGLAREEGLGIEVDDEARTLIGQGTEIQRIRNHGKRILCRSDYWCAI